MKEEFIKTAYTVSIISIIVNILLSIGKLIAGIVSHSAAMVSDAIHSASDVVSTFIVMIGIKVSQKDEDQHHPYGHERFECVAAIVLAMLLGFVGVELAISAIKKITSVSQETAMVPGMLALLMALVSIICKEAMFWYAKINAKKIDSPSLMADAWHHRSDALSSIGALLGIVMSRMGYLKFDSYASIVICIFILKAAYDIFMDSIDKMIDKSMDAEFEKEIMALACNTTGVKAVDSLKTRVFGNKIYVDLEILVDGSLTLFEAHDISEKVHDRIEEKYPKVKHVMIHVNPN